MINEKLVVVPITAKGLDVFLILIDGYPMVTGADVNPAGMGINDWQVCGWLSHGFG
ncbi:hypothetical protein GCM10028774_18450 [Spirosoma jeollabukense]